MGQSKNFISSLIHVSNVVGSVLVPQSQDVYRTDEDCCVQVQKQNYRHEKRRATNELLNVLKDPSIVIIADWLKVRGSLRSWTKLWCVLKPGILLLYRSHKAKVVTATCHFGHYCDVFTFTFTQRAVVLCWI